MDSISRRTLLTIPAAGLVTGLAPDLAAAELPRPAMPLKFKWPDGTEGDIKKYAGKVLAIEFLLTYCHACQNAGRIMEGYYKEFKNQGFQVLGLATNDHAEKEVGTFLGASGATFPVGIITREQAQQFLQHPMVAIFYLPQTAIIDRKGVVRYQHGGKLKPPPDDDARMRTEIMELLKAK